MAVQREAVERPLPSAALVLRMIDVTARWQYRLARIILIPLIRMVFRIEVMGKENIPPRGGYVIAADHHNWLDAPMVVIAFPVAPRINFVADGHFVVARGWAWAIMRFLARQIGGVLPLVIHGHADPSTWSAANECLARGGNLCIFPEGSYDESERRLMRFHKGFAKLALENGAPVVPISISGTKSLWLRKRVVIAIGEAISPVGQSIETLTSATRARVEAMRQADVPTRGPRLFSRLLSRLFP